MLDDLSIIRPEKPGYLERMKTKFYSVVTKRQRREINEFYAQNIINKDFSIIASFCGGGTLYHDIGMQFLSPTINLAFDGCDFLTFVENLKYYLSQDIVEYKTDKVSYPVGKIDNKVEIRFVHYPSFDNAKTKWDERSKRINYDKILIMAHDRDGMNSKECLERFDKLPYPKIMFTAKKYPYKWAVYCPCFRKKDCVGVMTGIANLKGQRFYELYTNMEQILNSL